MADEETTDRDDDSFEIDLDSGEDSSSLEEVFEEAVAAVDRVEKDHQRPAAANDGSDGAPEKADRGGDAAASRRVAELEEQLEAARDRLARTLADFDNFRKRSERERESDRRYALFNPLRDFLEVVDNLDRALAAQGSAEDLKLGIQMTVRQLQGLLERYGVEPVESVGEPFDPNVHEAVSREESDEVKVPTVVSELQKGYVLHQRLLRPAMVSVAMPTGGGGAAGDAADDEESEVEASSTG